MLNTHIGAAKNHQQRISAIQADIRHDILDGLSMLYTIILLHCLSSTAHRTCNWWSGHAHALEKLLAERREKISSYYWGLASEYPFCQPQWRLSPPSQSWDTPPTMAIWENLLAGAHCQRVQEIKQGNRRQAWEWGDPASCSTSPSLWSWEEVPQVQEHRRQWGWQSEEAEAEEKM